MKEISFIIPVFNGALTIAPLVDQIVALCADLDFEIVLINDGSSDRSEIICNEIAQKNKKVKFIQLVRNFGEHNAVMAGLNHGDALYYAILDDDGQNPPAEAIRLYKECKDKGLDVVYGRYQTKRHSLFRNLGSRFNDKIANIILGKPPEIYLSSFKVFNRIVRDELVKYMGSSPYVDGLIFRTTDRIGQILVTHNEREIGKSNYTLKKLVKLWLSMFIQHSVKPIRLASVLGAFMSFFSLVLIVLIIIEKSTTPNYPSGVPFILVSVIFFSGMQLVILGVLGEYLGRLYLDHSGNPQFLVRYKVD